MYPKYPLDAHTAAAKLVHTAVHRFQDASENLTDKAQVDAAYRKAFGPLQKILQKITGDSGAEHNYQHVWERISSRPSTERLLGAALLTQAVSEFEVLVGRLIRGVLEANPQILLGNERKFTLRDLETFDSIEGVRTSLAEDAADRIQRQGFVAWMTWFQSQLKIEIPGVFADAHELTEVFQRRHLMVHNGGIVNESYRTNLEGSPSLPEDGTRLNVSRAYLAHSIDLLEAAGVKIAAAAAFKYADDVDGRTASEEQLDRACFEALQRERWAVASDLSGWLIPRVRDNPARMRLQVNNWVARTALFGPESIAPEVESWDTRSLEDQYKLAKLALLGELQQAVELATVMIKAGSLSEVGWRTWPLLAVVREHAEATGAGLPSSDTWNTSHAH